MIRVGEWWEVVPQKAMLPLCGIPKNCGRIRLKEPLPLFLFLLFLNRWILGKGFCFPPSLGASDVDCCSWLSGPKISLDFDFSGNDLPIMYFNSGPNNIFEFSLSVKAWEFTLVIVSSFFWLFTNAINILNFWTYEQVFTDCPKRIRTWTSKSFFHF